MSREPERDATPDEHEIAAAEALRVALEDPDAANEDADFARALAVAHVEGDLPAAENEAILARAFAIAAARGSVSSLADRRRKKGRAVALSASVLAIAAGVALVVSHASTAPIAANSGPFERSTEPLFTLAASGADVESSLGSGRIDRIARVREAEFFQAQLDTWGAR